MTYLFFLITVVTEPLTTLVNFARHESSTSRATSSSFANGAFLFSALFVVSETCVANKMPFACKAGNSIARELARGAGHRVATRLVAGVRDVTST